MRTSARHSDIPCPDCGNAPVNHIVEKINALLGEAADFFPSFTFFSSSSPISRRIRMRAPSLFTFLAAIRLGSIIRAPDAPTSGRARCIWLEAERRGITMWEFRPFGIRREIFVAELPVPIIFDGLPRPDRTLSGKKGLPDSLAWVDNKPVLKKRLAAAGIPVARGGTAFTWKRVRGIFGQLKSPVIVKPSSGSRSRHTTTHITDEKELRAAYVRAKKLSPRIIIEEELAGHVYRGTVIAGKVVGIRRKEPPQVTGDGIHTLRQLIETENSRPERRGPVYGKIKINEIDKKMAVHDVPARGVTVILSDKTSVSQGGGSTDVTDVAHPDIHAFLEKIAVILDDHIVGADFIVDDIARPLSGQLQSGVIECNSLPFIDVHLFPLIGTPRDTAGALWDAVLAGA